MIIYVTDGNIDRTLRCTSATFCAVLDLFFLGSTYVIGPRMLQFGEYSGAGAEQLDKVVELIAELDPFLLALKACDLMQVSPMSRVRPDCGGAQTLTELTENLRESWLDEMRLEVPAYYEQLFKYSLTGGAIALSFWIGSEKSMLFLPDEKFADVRQLPVDSLRTKNVYPIAIQGSSWRTELEKLQLKE